MKHSHSRFIALAVAFVAAVVLALPVTALAGEIQNPGKPKMPAPKQEWYNGKSQHFRSTIVDENGNTLTEGEDFDRAFCYISDRSNTNADSVWYPTDDDMKDSGRVWERITFKGVYADIQPAPFIIGHDIMTLYEFHAPNVTKVEGEDDPSLQGTLQLVCGNPRTQFSTSDFILSRKPGEQPGDYAIIVNTDQEQIPDQGSNKAGTRCGIAIFNWNGYTTRYLAGDDICGFNYIKLIPGTLTIKPAYTQVNVTVAWKDSSNKDGIRPSAEDFPKYLTLTADGEATDAQAVVVENGDTYNVVFDNVRKYAYDENGVRHEIDYQVTQANIDGYTTDNATVGNEGTITNTHEIAAPAEKPSTEKPAAKKTSRKVVPQTGDRSANALAVVALGATALGAAVVMKKRNEL